MSEIYERAKVDESNFERSANLEAYFNGYILEKDRYISAKARKSRAPVEGKGGVPLSWNSEEGIVYVDHTDTHTLIIGPTASKKSRLVTIPAVRLLGSARESMIISDPKAEIYNRTASFLKQKEYNLYVLNMRDMKHGASWNPLAIPYKLYCQGDVDRAYEFVNDIAMNLTAMGHSEKDPFWDNSAGSFFAGLTLLLFKYCREFKQSDSVVHLGSVLQLRNNICSRETFEQPRNNPLWQYAKTDLSIAAALIGTMETANDTQAGILSVFDEKMQIFSMQPGLLSMLSRNDISFDEIDERPTALFLLLPDEKTTYHGLVSLFVKQSYEYLIYKAQEKRGKQEAKLKIRLNYILDEFSSLPTIKDFPAMITAARSRKIRFVIVAQGKKQLVLKYGEDTDTILSNCANWIYFTSRELGFLQELSELCGQKVRRGIWGPVISVSELQRLSKENGEALVLCGRLKPCLVKLPDIEVYDKNEWLSVPIRGRNLNEKHILEVDMVALMKWVILNQSHDMPVKENIKGYSNIHMEEDPPVLIGNPVFDMLEDSDLLTAQDKSDSIQEHDRKDFQATITDLRARIESI